MRYNWFWWGVIFTPVLILWWITSDIVAPGVYIAVEPSAAAKKPAMRSSQRKCLQYLSNLPFQRDNATHQGIFISQPDMGIT